jgi:hypothetical protein
MNLRERRRRSRELTLRIKGSLRWPTCMSC